MFAMTRRTSAPNVDTGFVRSMRSSRSPPTDATTNTPAPRTTTIHVGNAAAAPNAKPIPITWNSAPPACDTPLPCNRSLPDKTSGIAADFTASATRTHPWMNKSPTISATVAPTLPSDVSLPSGNITPTAISATTAATTRFVQVRIFRRSVRSMTTPMNGLTSVYGTYNASTTFSR